MLSQRDAVFKVVSGVVGEINGPVELNQPQKEEVYKQLFNMFTNGQVQLKGERTSDWIKKYIPGLVNNWLRKDKRLNGGVQYVTKNPGSRAGSGDPTLKALRELLKATSNPVARADIEKEIEARLEVLKPKVEIDISLIPEHLRKYI